MRLFLNIVGLLFYCFSIYCMFFSNPGDNGSLFKMVGGDAYNYNYAFLAAITFSVIGTGFIVMALSYPSKKYDFDFDNTEKILDEIDVD